MYKKNQVLTTSADFDNAIMFQIQVAVWQNGEILDYGGIIELNSDESVKIQGNYYFKMNCEFRVR